MNTINKLKQVGTDRLIAFGLSKLQVPRRYTWPFLRTIKKVSSPYKYLTRKNKVNKMITNQNILFELPKEKFVILSQEEIPYLKNIVNHCSELYDKKSESVKKYFEGKEVKKRDKQFYVNFLSLNENGEAGDFYEYTEIEPIIKFATSQEMLKIAAKYLEEVPLLGEINFLFSRVNDLTTESQLYHLDGKDHKRLKLFVAIGDVDKTNGPFTLLPRSISKNVIEKTKYDSGRIADEEVYKHTSKEEAIEVVGEKGSSLLIDTSQCLHYGSRCRIKPRLMLEIHYVSRFNPVGIGYEKLINKIHREDLRKFNKIEKYLK
jgi:hypothetical protein